MTSNDADPAGERAVSSYPNFPASIVSTPT
jgi:hypothetical protein